MKEQSRSLLEQARRAIHAAEILALAAARRILRRDGPITQCFTLLPRCLRRTVSDRPNTRESTLYFVSILPSQHGSARSSIGSYSMPLTGARRPITALKRITAADVLVMIDHAREFLVDAERLLVLTWHAGILGKCDRALRFGVGRFSGNLAASGRAQRRRGKVFRAASATEASRKYCWLHEVRGWTHRRTISPSRSRPFPARREDSR